MAQRQTGAVDGEARRLERILAYMLASTIGLSILSFLAVIFGTLAGMRPADFAAGLWPVVSILPLIALPIGFIIVIVLIVINGRRRAREAAADKKNPRRPRGS